MAKKLLSYPLFNVGLVFYNIKYEYEQADDFHCALRTSYGWLGKPEGP